MLSNPHAAPSYTLSRDPTACITTFFSSIKKRVATLIFSSPSTPPASFLSARDWHFYVVSLDTVSVYCIHTPFHCDLVCAYEPPLVLAHCVDVMNCYQLHYWYCFSHFCDCPSVKHLTVLSAMLFPVCELRRVCFMRCFSSYSPHPPFLLCLTVSAIRSNRLLVVSIKCSFKTFR